MIRRLRNRERGFTLIELLIVVAIIGIIAAILIPNLIDAIQKAKQKRTVSDERGYMTAIMSWISDNASAAAAGRRQISTFTLQGMSTPSVGDMNKILHPTPTFFYIQTVQQADGWGWSFQYFMNSNYTTDVRQMLSRSTQLAAVRSCGRDGTMNCDGPTYTVGTYISTMYDNDIVFADGLLITGPGGVTN